MALRDARILVIGSSGFIGQNLVDGFLREGAFVSGYDIRPGPNFSDERRFDFHLGGGGDLDIISKMMDGVDVVVHLAAGIIPSSNVHNYIEAIAHNVGEPASIADIASKRGVKRFIFASSGGAVYGRNGEEYNDEYSACRPINFYGAAKLSTEALISVVGSMNGMRTIILRISNPYGSGQVSRGQGIVAAAIESGLRDQELSLWGDGSVIRDYVHISDVVRAFVASCLYDGSESIFNIGSGVGTSVISVVNEVKIFIPTLKIVFEPSRKIDIPTNVLRIERAKNELNWLPLTSLATGVEGTVRWWQATMM